LPPPPVGVLERLGITLVAPSPRPLKTGGFKSVYAARHDETNEEVVVTVEATQHFKDDHETHRIEQAVMQRLATSPTAHPNFVALKAPPLEQDGRLFLVLERCEQEVFDVLIDAGAPKTGVGEAAARDLFVQAIAGLHHMHRLGIAHRDVKLENMLLTKEGVLKLIDFGLGHVAAVPSDPLEPFAMESDRDLGSRAYTAPEVRAVATRRAPYSTTAADVWSLGVCLFALVTGYWPLKEAIGSDWRFTKLREAQASGTSSCAAIFSWYKRSVAGFSADLISLLDGMLMIDPDARLTVEQCLASAWLKGDAAHEAASAYQNDVTRMLIALPCGLHANNHENDLVRTPSKDMPQAEKVDLQEDGLHELEMHKLRLQDATDALSLEEVTTGAATVGAAAACLPPVCPPPAAPPAPGEDEDEDDAPIYRTMDHSIYHGYEASIGVHYHQNDTLYVDDVSPTYRCLSLGHLPVDNMYGAYDEDGEVEGCVRRVHDAEVMMDVDPPTIARQDARLACMWGPNGR